MTSLDPTLLFLIAVGVAAIIGHLYYRSETHKDREAISRFCHGLAAAARENERGNVFVKKIGPHCVAAYVQDRSGNFVEIKAFLEIALYRSCKGPQIILRTFGDSDHSAMYDRTDGDISSVAKEAFEIVRHHRGRTRYAPPQVGATITIDGPLTSM